MLVTCSTSLVKAKQYFDFLLTNPSQPTGHRNLADAVHQSTPQNRKQLIAFLLKTTSLTTPTLETYLKSPLTAQIHLTGNQRNYRLCLPDGACVEAGVVRALSIEGLPLLQIPEPLGPWARSNGYSCEKKQPVNLHIADPGHPIAQTLETPCEHIIGRGYLFLLKKHNSLIPLQIEEYWNTALF